MPLSIEDAAAEWRRAFGAYDQRRALAEAGVVRWIYTKEPVPLSELTGLPSSELLADFDTAPGEDHCATGFDARGHPLIERSVSRSGSRVIDRFWHYKPDYHVSVQFSWFSPQMPTEVTLFRSSEGRLLEKLTWWITPGPGLAGSSASAVEARIETPNVITATYEWAGDRVLSVRREMTGPFVSAMGGRMGGTGHWTYDDYGLLKRTFTYDGQREQLIWERPRTEESDADVYTAAVEALVAAVPKVVRAGPRVYAVALCYHYPDAMLPPLVAIARLDRRGSPSTPHQRNAEWIGGFDEVVELRDEMVIKASERAVARAKGDADVLRAILRDASRALTQSGTWTAPRTTDFVVLPADFELEDLPATISEVSPEQFAKIRSNGWLIE